MGTEPPGCLRSCPFFGDKVYPPLLSLDRALLVFEKNVFRYFSFDRGPIIRSSFKVTVFGGVNYESTIFPPSPPGNIFYGAVRIVDVLRKTQNVIPLYKREMDNRQQSVKVMTLRTIDMGFDGKKSSNPYFFGGI